MLNVIVNQTARRAEKLAAQAEETLKSAGVPCRVFYTDKRGAAIKYARSLSQTGGTEFMVIGGDGTVNEVLSGLEDPSRCTLAVLPAGTGNDFAAAADIPLGAKALELYLEGESRPVDYIECGQRRSLNIVGMGIDVEILRRCEGMRYGSRKGRYFRALVASLLSYRGEKVRVTVDGESREYTALIAALCNGTRLGGGIPLCPPARYDDGRLELVVVECPPFAKLLPELIRLMRGKLLTRPITHHIACTEATLTGGGYVQYDGEIVGQETLCAHIVRGGLKMYCGR